MQASLKERGLKAGALAVENGFTLPIGLKMPAIGLGTWQTPKSKEGALAITTALDLGYRLFDCAAFYGNEVAVGYGFSQSPVRREKYFVTSKVWRTSMGYQKTMDSFFRTLNELDTEYLDLLLIHWPASPNKDANWQEINSRTWDAMMELYEEGHVRAIGVSNFKAQHLEPLLKSRIKPMVNQIEFHPGYMQRDVIELCREHDIVVEGWSPFGRGAVLDNEVVVSVANKHQVTPAQVCIRYALQHGVLPLPKTVNPERMVENLEIFHFELDETDMAALDALDNDKVGYSGEDPDM